MPKKSFDGTQILYQNRMLIACNKSKSNNIVGDIQNFKRTESPI